MTNQPFSAAITVRFRDLDKMGHVNNATYATYLEEARSAFFRAVLDESLPDADTVLAHLEIDFHAPIEHETEVEVVIRSIECGESSIRMEYEVRSNGSTAATAETVQVVWDPTSEESRPMPEEWRERIETYRQG